MRRKKERKSKDDKDVSKEGNPEKRKYINAYGRMEGRKCRDKKDRKCRDKETRKEIKEGSTETRKEGQKEV